MNEFIIKNGYRSQGNSEITGSLSVTAGITGSLQGTSSFALTASYVAGASSFPFTGSAQITGSLGITGSLNVTGSQVYLKTNGFIVENVDVNASLIEATTAGGVYVWSTNSNPSADFENRQLLDENGNATVVWTTQRTLEHDNGAVVDWANQTLNDYTTLLSVDWDNRQLIQSDGATVTLDWETGAMTGSFTGSFVGDGSGLTGVGATEYIRRSDYTSSLDPNVNYLYTGYAPVGSAESATVWTLSRLAISASGDTITQVTASAAWTNRYSYTYL